MAGGIVNQEHASGRLGTSLGGLLAERDVMRPAPKQQLLVTGTERRCRPLQRRSAPPAPSIIGDFWFVRPSKYRALAALF